MELRRLPFVIHPLPDEPFGSWFETMASTLGTSCGDLSHALGLRVQAAEALSVTSWSARLDDLQLDSLERVTGLSRKVMHATTREGFAANAVQYDRRGGISIFSPVNGVSGRYCPDCLRDSGGRWRMTWQFPFGFACVRHRRLLADTCPVCGKPPYRAGLPHRLVPVPGACRNRIGHNANGRVMTCDADLRESDAQVIKASDEVLNAQRLIMRALSRSRTADGIWASAPQPASRVLGDLRILASYARRSGAERGDRSRDPHAAEELSEAFAAACRAVHEPALLEGLLRNNVTEYTPYHGLSPQLQTMIASARGMKRRPTFVLQTAYDGGDPAKRASKVPALLWKDWANHLAPRRIDRANAAMALSAAVVVAGSRLTHAAGLRMLDEQAPSRRVTSVMRILGTGSSELETLQMIVQLAQHLDDAETPIDYARRRELDYAGLLPVDEWEQIAITQNVHAGLPRRAALARAHVHRLLSGDQARHLQSLGGRSTPVSDAEIDGFASNAPTHVLAALNTVGEAYLRRASIDEPLTWQPDPRRLGLRAFRSTPASAVREEWSPRRPARGHPDGVEAAAVIAAHENGLSIRAAAEELGLSRQSVSRTLAAQGVRLPPGRQPRFHIDPDWLRQQYEAEGRSVADIANEIGCSTGTVRRHARFGRTG
ncbi:MAG TPA: TniQ family protein [Marmoricola sp.]|nr:TniQ family protein [Marmoricola sp.]